MYRYFTYREFDSPDDPGSGELMDPEFLQMLDEARHIYGRPMIINSGYRTSYWNKVLKRKGYIVAQNSAHLTGNAADIHCADPRERWAMLCALQQVGFHRIGLGRTFVHVDNDMSKTPQCLWTY